KRLTRAAVNQGTDRGVREDTGRGVHLSPAEVHVDLLAQHAAVMRPLDAPDEVPNGAVSRRERRRAARIDRELKDLIAPGAVDGRVRRPG
ncbi:hypothetical protein DKP78_19800, partial [Enterococcus faecium]